MLKSGAFCCTWLALCVAAVVAETGNDVTYENPIAQVSYESCSACSDLEACGCDACSYGRGYVFPQDRGFFNVYGWVDGGIVWNTSDPASKFNGPYNAVDRGNEGMLNQVYLVAERELPNCGHGIGGRIDLLYGEDYLLAESIGIEKRPDGLDRWNSEYYGLAVPQAYASLGNKRLSLQVGHFYSIVGYEGVMSPDNFFYSKSYSYQFAGPFTHWGAQLNMQVRDAWTLQLGLHNGWDAFDRVSDDVGVIGKVRYDSQHSDAWTSFAITTGKDFNNLAGLPLRNDFTNRTRYSWIASLPLTCRLEYVMHHWLGLQQAGAVGGRQADWYGIDQYLYHTFNDCWKAGLRFEWFRDEEGTRVGLNRPSNPNGPPLGGNFYSLSLGLNWKPNDNFVLRPEVRTDWYDGNGARLPYDDGNDDNQTMFGVDAIFLF